MVSLKKKSKNSLDGRLLMWFEHYLQKKLNQVCMVCIESLSLTPDCAHTSGSQYGQKADFSK